MWKRTRSQKSRSNNNLYFLMYQNLKTNEKVSLQCTESQLKHIPAETEKVSTLLTRSKFNHSKFSTTSSKWSLVDSRKEGSQKKWRHLYKNKRTGEFLTVRMPCDVPKAVSSLKELFTEKSAKFERSPW